jgi:PAS domain S-box-containing protein
MSKDSKSDLGARRERLEKQTLSLTALRCSIIDLEMRHQEMLAEKEQLVSAHEQLRSARDHYRDLFESGPFAYVVVDEHGEIEDANLAAAALLGEEHEKTIGTRLGNWIQGSDVVAFLEHLRRCRRRDETVVTQVRLRKSDGAIIHAELCSRPSSLDKARFGVAITDVSDRVGWESERREAEEARYRAAAREQAAAESSRTKDRFFAVLSHELRTPLAPIVNASIKLKQTENLPEDARAAAEMIHRNAELQTRLIEDLLDMTRSLAGKLQLDFQVVDVHAVIRDATEALAGLAHETGMQIDLALGAHHHFARTDPGRLHQVISNLVRNAVEHSATAKKISVASSDSPGGKISVSVSDFGVGIKEEDLHRIFDPFEQLNAPGEHSSGLGLGLTIARGLVGALGGSIRAKSDGLGTGATFTFELETTDAPPLRVVRKPAAETQPQSGARVLIVEDHVDTATSLAELLQMYGYQTRLAHGFEAALEAAVEDFDVVISDIALPDGSGLELMRKLHESRGFDGIALSGFGSEADVIAARRAGFKEHLTKPADVRRLLSAIERVTTQHARARRTGH